MVPKVSAEDVQRVIARDFPAEDAELVGSVLAELGPESDRVRLAVLKLAAGSLNELDRYARAACYDFRDVLLWAEYSAQSRLPSSAGDPEQAAAIQKDWAEYQAWLGRACDPK